ncbi:MAG: PulJ/GspJ family protein [Bacillota bacterium]
MSRLFKNKKGLTLIEVIVSIAILSIIVAPLGNLFVTTIRNNAMSERQLRANQTAKTIIEQVAGNIDYYIGSTPLPFTDNGVTFNTSIIEFYNPGHTSTTGSSPLSAISMTAGFEIGPGGGTKLTALTGDIISIEVTDSNIVVKHTNNSGPSPITTQFMNLSYTNIGDINIQINCNLDVKVNINVTNNTSHTVNIYKVYSNTLPTAEFIVNTILGAVRSYDLIYDSSVANANQNKVYRVIVTATYNGSRLVELARLVTIE